MNQQQLMVRQIQMQQIMQQAAQGKQLNGQPNFSPQSLANSPNMNTQQLYATQAKLRPSMAGQKVRLAILPVRGPLLPSCNK
jgi:hypothetical protein